MPNHCEFCSQTQLINLYAEDEVESEFFYTNDDGSQGWMYNMCTEPGMMVCQNCGRFYQVCTECHPSVEKHVGHKEFPVCQFLGCGLIGCDYRSELREQREPDLELGYRLTEAIMQSSPHYLSFIDRKINGIKNEDIEPITGEKMTGHDGGNYLYWKCNECDRIFYTCDK
jgi:hypothetical protein